MMYVIALLGFVLLIAGAEIMVRGAVGISKRLHISTLVIGMVVISIGTSAPELVVSLNAALQGAYGISVGNVVGSNIANMLLVLGASASIVAIRFKPSEIRFDAWTMVAGTVLFVLLAVQGRMDFLAGLVLLVVFIIFLVNSYMRERKSRTAMAKIHEEEVKELTGIPKSLPLMIGQLIGGLLGILLGSELLVNGSVQIAKTFGVGDEVIGVTLVALGTSFPELAASVVAAFRKHAGLALGNVLGSNLFNLLAIIGLTAVVRPLEVADQLIGFDLWILLAVSVLLALLLSRGQRLGRVLGVVFLGLYAAYIIVQFTGAPHIGLL